MKKKYICFFSLSCSLGFGQTVNEGIFTILPMTDVSTQYSFINEKEAAVQNDGTFYFYADFTNNGLYTFDEKRKTSYAVFQPQESSNGIQYFLGSASSEFYDVLFNNSGALRTFELRNDISIFGTANFKEGIIDVDDVEGSLVFQPNAKPINVSDYSHVNGKVEKIGRENFVFPIGNKGIYRFAEISSQPDLKGNYLGKYYFKNSNLAHPHKDKMNVIQQINNAEYWTIEKEGGNSDIILTLSWDSRTTPIELLVNAETELRILRWDVGLKIWVDEGGVVDLASKTVTTPTQVDGYGVFTLGTVKNDMSLLIYNAVSPNGDGLNDYFLIDNINKFPNNSVQIFNRWGIKVFDTKNYGTNNNVFTGVSDGRVTMDKNQKLPTGTYFYIINYEFTDKSGTTTNKKTGYLHLENN